MGCNGQLCMYVCNKSDGRNYVNNPGNKSCNRENNANMYAIMAIKQVKKPYRSSRLTLGTKENISATVH